MRPVDRGPDPGGYAAYGEAYGALVAAIGRYCSYCEAPLKNGHVEHALPKSVFPELAVSWSNLLVACSNCNATKGDWPDADQGGRAAAFWPDLDNTARAYDYPTHRPPRPASALSPEERALSRALLGRTGVDRSPGHARWSNKDDRWELRYQVWDNALECRDELALHDTPIHRKRIAEVASARGFWSVWRAVFTEDPDMLRRLDAAFVGTAAGNIDAVGRAVPRGGGRL